MKGPGFNPNNKHTHKHTHFKVPRERHDLKKTMVVNFGSLFCLGTMPDCAQKLVPASLGVTTDSAG